MSKGYSYSEATTISAVFKTKKQRKAWIDEKTDEGYDADVTGGASLGFHAVASKFEIVKIVGEGELVEL